MNARRTYDALLTGIPFGTYKLGFGVAVYAVDHTVLGFILIAWGVVDILMNLVGIFVPKRVASCLLAGFGRRLDQARSSEVWEERGLALDTLLSFSIVSTMILVPKLFSQLPAPLVKAWELAVVSNVMGVGVARVYETMQLKSAAED